MKRFFTSYKLMSIPVIAAIILMCGISAPSKKNISSLSEGEARPDAIVIDSMKVFGDLEKPNVPFLHDAHTDALEKKKKDCKTCHESKDNKLSPKFMRLEDKSKKSVMDIYHEGCVGCHQEMINTDEKTGPVVCAECHTEKPDVQVSREPMGMDKSLHYRHLKPLDNKCELCHHEYNKKTQKIYYEKGKEGTCRYCHKKVTEEGTRSMEQASHASCIDCHMKTLEKKKEAGPVKCSGCHELKAQLAIEKVKRVPRIERKQPDTVLVKTGNKDLDAPGKNRMNLVPFNHKDHEDWQETCRVCHHADISACSKCHTLEGMEDGDNIRLEKAMHWTDSRHSCQGCHAIKQQDKNCAGCHVFLDKNRKQDEASCLACHMNPLPGAAAGIEEADMAAQLLASRKAVTGTYAQQDIPEKVVIKKMSDQYKPAEFPHRKIVNTINDNIKENRLAMYFHADTGTLCQGCHHNSPAAKKPPRCDSCHGSNVDAQDVFKPGIKGAYHIQCMGCHTSMEIDKVGCTDCHEKKK